MSHYVFWNKDYNVLICKEHQYAISSKYLARHFLEEHTLSRPTRQAILAHASQYVITEAVDLVYKDEAVAPIPYLKVIEGYQCLYDLCHKIHGSEKGVREHCRVNHEWKAKDGERWVRTRAQTFYQGNNQRYVHCNITNKRYFAVRESGTLHVTNFTEQLLEGLLDQAERQDNEHRQQLNKVLDTTSLVTKTPWLRYTKWESLFVDQDMNELHELTNLPKATITNENEHEILLATMTDKILRACWNGFHDCRNRGWDLLPFWLSSVARDKEDTKPFRSFIAPYTLSRYIGYWQSYILLCYRMYNMQDIRLQFTTVQEELLKTIGRLIDDYDENQGKALYDLLFELSIALICHSDYAKESSSLIYYTGVRGYNVDYKQWRPPQHYTTILAGIQFCIRILILEHALPTATRDEFTENSILTPVDKFCEIRNKWLIDGASISLE